MENKTSGSGFLKVCGILMIIGGGLALIFSIIGFAGIAVLQAALGADFKAGIAWAGIILSLVAAIVELVAGIVGVVNCKKPEKAKACIFWGACVIVLSLAGAILTAASGSDFPIVSLLTGLIVPGLYIFGAIKNMKG